MLIKCGILLRLILFGVLLCLAHIASAQTQYTLRIGVIDSERGATLKGARLAARQINAAGGLVGADGTVFSLRIVDTPPVNMDIAIANMRQSRVIAVLGPNTDELVTANMAKLQSLDVPIFSAATGDTILLQDFTKRVFRSRAADSVQTNALAEYLVNVAGIRSISTIQLDDASTGNIITLANALSRYGIRLSNIRYDEARGNLDDIVRNIQTSSPDAVAIYGPPLLAAQAHTKILGNGYQGMVVYNRASDPTFLDNVPAETVTGIISSASWTLAQLDLASKNFTLDYALAFGDLPDAVSAAAYDVVHLVASGALATGSPARNLASIQSFDGVQGELNPAALSQGEISSNAVVTQLNEYGSPFVAARYHGGRQLSADEIKTAVDTPTPYPTLTPYPTPTPSGYNLTIQSTFQNVRNGPGLEFQVIGQLQQGTQARVLGATADFSWLVIDHEGQWGWLAAYLVSNFGNPNLVPIIQPPATATPAATFTPLPSQQADLVILDVQPPRLTVGAYTAATVTVLNQGLTFAGPFAVASNFLPGAQYTAANLSGLAAGQQISVQLQPNLSGASGPQSIVMVVDLNNQVHEGVTGEANNSIYFYNYIADRAIGTSGNTSIAAGAAIDLDLNGTLDFNWTGSELVGVGNARMYVMSNFRSIDEVHYDSIDISLTNIATLNVNLLPNTIIGFISDAGKRGVMQLTSVAHNGPLSFIYRLYR